MPTLAPAFLSPPWPSPCSRTVKPSHSLSQILCACAQIASQPSALPLPQIRPGFSMVTILHPLFHCKAPPSASASAHGVFLLGFPPVLLPPFAISPSPASSLRGKTVATSLWWLLLFLWQMLLASTPLPSFLFRKKSAPPSGGAFVIWRCIPCISGLCSPPHLCR